jgi:hypothetical protein
MADTRTEECKWYRISFHIKTDKPNFNILSLGGDGPTSKEFSALLAKLNANKVGGIQCSIAPLEHTYIDKYLTTQNANNTQTETINKDAA